MEQNLKSRRTAQKLRREQTKEGNHLWYDFLKTYPVQFRRQYPIGCYYVDFFCYQAMLIVELEGAQHTEPEAIAYDRARTKFLQEKGYYVLRISNLDIWRNFAGVCEMIDLCVKSRKCNRGQELPSSAPCGGTFPQGKA